MIQGIKISAEKFAKALKLSLESNAQTGFADNEAIPNETATRAEAVVMLLRMLELNG